MWPVRRVGSAAGCNPPLSDWPAPRPRPPPCILCNLSLTWNDRPRFLGKMELQGPSRGNRCGVAGLERNPSELMLQFQGNELKSTADLTRLFQFKFFWSSLGFFMETLVNDWKLVIAVFQNQRPGVARFNPKRRSGVTSRQLRHRSSKFRPVFFFFLVVVPATGQCSSNWHRHQQRLHFNHRYSFIHLFIYFIFQRHVGVENRRRFISDQQRHLTSTAAINTIIFKLMWAPLPPSLPPSPPHPPHHPENW